MGRRGPLARAKGPDGKPLEVSLASTMRPATGVPLDVPPCPPKLLVVAQQAWTSFWTSGAASWVDRGSAMPRLVRWIYDVDMYHRILRDLRPGVRPGLHAVEIQVTTKRGDTYEDVVQRRDEEGVLGVLDGQRPWLGIGSTGQITAHPSTGILDQLSDRIHKTEIEFGMTPYAAVRLAGAGVQGQLTAAQLRDMLAKNDNGATPEEDAPWAAGFKSA